jgi:hypothetical protein
MRGLNSYLAGGFRCFPAAVLLFLLPLGARSVEAADPFLLAKSYAAGSNPTCVARADFDGDGWPDLVVSNGGESKVRVFLNKKDGTFAPAVSYDADYEPEGVAVGDFNRDGKVDIVAAHPGHDSISILLNNGDGSFAAPSIRSVGTGTSPYAVAVGDLNGDGSPDIVTANYDSDNVAVFINKNDGSGTFKAVVRYTVKLASDTNPSRPDSVVLADFNGDGKLDIATANYYGGTVSVLLNKAAAPGTFAAPKKYEVDNSTNGIAAADLNGDGRMDIVTVSGAAEGPVSVLINKPTAPGTFRPSVPYDVKGLYPSAVAVMDVDGSGGPDIIVTNFGDDTISVLKNKGNGTFASPVKYAVGEGPYSALAGDVNGDGRPDLVAANKNGSSISVVMNSGEWIFAAPVAYHVPEGDAARVPNAVAAGDLNGDGKADLVAATTRTEIAVLMNLGKGSFAPQVLYDASDIPSAVAIADFDGDGKADIVTANKGADKVAVLLNGGGGVFGAPTSYTVGNDPVAVAVGDFDKDGDIDIVTANETGDNISVIMNSGNGTFGSPTNYPSDNAPSAVVVADIDNDGTPDIVVANRSAGNISIFYNNGNGTFAPAVKYNVGNSPTAVATGDVNADGCTDVVVANYQTGGGMVVLTNNCTSHVLTPTSYDAGSYPSSLVVGNFVGDAKPDIIVANSGDGTMSVYQNRGSDFAQQVTYPIGIGAASLATADFDTSGKLDLAVALDRDLAVVFAADTRPSGYAFAPATRPRLKTAVSSNIITVQAVNSPSPISITGGEYSINGGAFASTAGAVYLGDEVQVRLTSSGSYGTKTTATLTIGGVSRPFDVTTDNVPTLGALSPSSSSSNAGAAKIFVAGYRDLDGYTDLKTVDFLAGPSNGSNAIWVRYDRSLGKLFLAGDGGSFSGAGCTPGVAGTLTNSQGSLRCLQTTVSGSGNVLTVKWNIVPKAAFASGTPKELRMTATDDAGYSSGSMVKGDWTVNP